MKYMISIISLGVLFFAGCTTSEATETAGHLQSSNPQQGISEESGARLLFFMNPYGRPCQIQDHTLNEIRSDIETKADIVYVRTDRDNDRSLFYQYGVRSLPVMILVDAGGTVLKRFTPGPQSSRTIMTALEAVR